MSDLGRYSPRGERQQGVALVIVIWTMALLALLMVGFLSNVRSQLSIARNDYEQAQARALAEAGISLAILGALEPDPDARWRLDGTVQTLAFAGGIIRASVQNEAGKIDLNRAPEPLLAGLFRTVGVAEAQSAGLLQSIARWKTGRLEAWAAVGGATTVGPFLAVEEFQSVPGMSPELFDLVAPFVTVHSRQTTIDPLSAPIEVLRSIPGVTSGAIEAFLEARSRPEVVPALTGAASFLASSYPQAVMVRSEGATAAGTTAVREGVIEIGGGPGMPYSMVAWRAAAMRAESEIGR
jgi:general secretion pathway protein K